MKEVVALKVQLQEKDEETSNRIVSWQRARLNEAFNLFNLGQSSEEMCEDDLFAIGSALHNREWNTSRNHETFIALNPDGNGHVRRDDFLSLHEKIRGDLSDTDFNAGMDNFMDGAREEYTERLRIKGEEQIKALEARINELNTEAAMATEQSAAEGHTSNQASSSDQALALYKARAVGQEAAGLDMFGAASDLYVAVMHWRHAAGIQPRQSLAYRCLRLLMWLTEAFIIATVLFYVYAWRQKRLQRQYA